MDSDPILALADLEGPVRRKNDQAEHGLSRWVTAFLERTIIGACWFTAVETGTWLPGSSEQGRMNAETKRRARGIKPAHLDWYLWQKSTGQFTQFELKVYGRPTRQGQKDTMAALRRNEIPTGVYETVPEVCEFLLASGFVLHGNARNIAAELHERYLAQRREKAPAKRKRASTRAPRSTAAAIAQGHKMGAWK